MKEKFRVGDSVVARGNYQDEQLGHHAPTGDRTITKVKDVPYSGTSGQWVQTDRESDWVDAAWFEKAGTQYESCGRLDADEWREEYSDGWSRWHRDVNRLDHCNAGPRGVLQYRKIKKCDGSITSRRSC